MNRTTAWAIIAILLVNTARLVRLTLHPREPAADHAALRRTRAALTVLRADSTALATRMQTLQKERNEAIERLQSTRRLLAAQMQSSRSLAADSIMRGLLADPPGALDTIIHR